jgi:hypothetical protein
VGCGPLELLELTDFAWHDCYGEVTPPEHVVDDLFVVAQGTLAGLVRAAGWPSRTPATVE